MTFVPKTFDVILLTFDVAPPALNSTIIKSNVEPPKAYSTEIESASTEIESDSTKLEAAFPLPPKRLHDFPMCFRRRMIRMKRTIRQQKKRHR